MSRSTGLKIFKQGSIEELTGEQYMVLTEAVAYHIEQENKALKAVSGSKRGSNKRTVRITTK